MLTANNENIGSRGLEKYKISTIKKIHHPDLPYSTPHWHDAKCRAKDLHSLPRGKHMMRKETESERISKGGGPALSRSMSTNSAQCNRFIEN